MKTHKDFDEKVWTTIATTIIFLIIIFIVLQLFSNETVSLVKDLLGVVSTVFTAFVAIYIFKGWLIQKRLEVLSEQSKSYLFEFPSLYLGMLNFFTSVSDFLHRLELYKEYKKPNLLSSMEQLSSDLYKHEFMTVIISFNNQNSELMSLMPENDLKILNQISDDLELLKNYIYVEKILNIQTFKDKDLQKIQSDFEELQNRMFKNFDVFHKKLVNYKNYTFEK